jgi:sporulation protein YlmC with PRC-barrel domain
MPTPSGHTTAILASKVKGTAVYNAAGDRVGTVEDIVLDKLSNNIMFVVLGSGGVLGMGEQYRPIPWSVLDFDQTMNGYVISMDKEKLEKAPAYRMEDLTKADGSNGAILSKTYSYYNVPQYW